MIYLYMPKSWLEFSEQLKISLFFSLALAVFAKLGLFSLSLCFCVSLCFLFHSLALCLFYALCCSGSKQNAQTHIHRDRVCVCVCVFLNSYVALCVRVARQSMRSKLYVERVPKISNSLTTCSFAGRSETIRSLRCAMSGLPCLVSFS